MQKVHDKIIYLDSASTTPIHPEIQKDLNTLIKSYYGNADSLHKMGQRVSSLVEKSRLALSEYFNVLPHEIIFTSGGSEANAMAIKGIALSAKGKHIITSNIEHSSVEASLEQLETYFDYEVSRLKVNAQGFVDPEVLKNALREDTCLVTMMHVNNEIGSVFPIETYAKLIKKHSNAYFHVDGVQAFCKMDVSLTQVDSYAISAHKLGGLKGSGLLVKKANVPLMPLIPGGQQEYGLRGGTLNSVAAIVFAKTVRLALQIHKESINHIQMLYHKLWEAFNNKEGFILNSSINGSPYIFNLTIQNVPSEIMMNALNAENILVSAKSTCHSESKDPSLVLKALGLSDEDALSSIRISLHDKLTLDDINKTIDIILKTKEYVSHEI